MRFLCVFAAVFVGTCIVAARFIQPDSHPPAAEFRYSYAP